MDANARQHLFAICSCLPVLSIELEGHLLVVSYSDFQLVRFCFAQSSELFVHNLLPFFEFSAD